VLFTTIVVGLVAQVVIPGLPAAAAFALGAIVAPPDAVAATAVFRRLGVPPGS
jgi:CPA1 family monovalent cation:H+ antiporter